MKTWIRLKRKKGPENNKIWAKRNNLLESIRVFQCWKMENSKWGEVKSSGGREKEQRGLVGAVTPDLLLDLNWVIKFKYRGVKRRPLNFPVKVFSLKIPVIRTEENLKLPPVFHAGKFSLRIFAFGKLQSKRFIFCLLQQQPNCKMKNFFQKCKSAIEKLINSLGTSYRKNFCLNFGFDRIIIKKKRITCRKVN